MDTPTKLEQALARIANQDAIIAELRGDLAARDMRIAELAGEIEGAHKVFDGANVTWSLGNDVTRLPLVKRCSLAVVGNNLAELERQALEQRIADLERDLAADARATQAEASLAEMVKALDDAGAPQAYHLEDGTERPIPDPERIRLLGERVHALRVQVREAADATNYLDALIEAHNALDGLGAPRLADGCVLSLAARIRSLPH